MPLYTHLHGQHQLARINWKSGYMHGDQIWLDVFIVFISRDHDRKWFMGKQLHQIVPGLMFKKFDI